ncbi:MAG: hypothetical protein NTV23_11840 [Propionibacteriales bacterium]|nr:hypothetical protein [Propionibacteriales bacterium]
MTKLIAVLTAPDAALHDPTLHQRLAAAGATALQVNLDDDAVAPAMRFGPGAPITGFVTAWTDDPEATLAALTGIAEGTHVYRVTEHRPVEPPPVPYGERADALANVAVLRRPDGMSQEEYLEIWLGSHTAIASETQHTFGYVQNVVEEALTPGAPVISAIVEELFDMGGMTDPHVFYGSGGDDAELNRRITRLMTSVARFGADQGLDLVPTSRYLYDV